MADELSGIVAWVAGVGAGESDRARRLGHAAALLLAAKGAHVFVTGESERVLGACVGEIVHGGGKGRHLVAKPTTTADARACVSAAVERFGGLHVVVHCSGALEDAARAFDAARDVVGRGGRFIVLAADSAGDPRVAPFVHEVARAFAPRGITCNAVVTGDLGTVTRAADAEEFAELAAVLVGALGAVVAGSTLTIG